MAPGHCVVEVVPGGQRGRGAGQAGDQRRFRQRQLPGRFSEQVPGHRLDAVDAGAEVDAIQVQLEDLILRQLRVDHDRQHRFVELAGVGLAVGQEQRPGELLRQRRAPLERSRLATFRTTARAEPDRIDPDVAVEPMVFYRDEGVLQIGRDVGQRHVLPLFIHPEPLLPVRREEPRVADPARQPVDRVALTHGPRHADGRRNREHDEHEPPRPGRGSAWPERHRAPGAAARRGPARATGRCSRRDTRSDTASQPRRRSGSASDQAQQRPTRRAEHDRQAAQHRRPRRIHVADPHEDQRAQRQQDGRVDPRRQPGAIQVQRDDVPVGRETGEEMVAVLASASAEAVRAAQQHRRTTRAIPIRRQQRRAVQQQHRQNTNVR